MADIPKTKGWGDVTYTVGFVWTFTTKLRFELEYLSVDVDIFMLPLKVLQLSVGRSVDQVYEISRNASEFGKFSQTTPPRHTSKWILIPKVWFEIWFIVGGDANVFK